MQLAEDKTLMRSTLRFITFASQSCLQSICLHSICFVSSQHLELTYPVMAYAELESPQLC